MNAKYSEYEIKQALITIAPAKLIKQRNNILPKYFAFVSLGFLVPLILLRLYVFIAFIWSGNKPISLWKIWITTQGNNLRLLISFCLWFFISIFLLSSISNTFSASAAEAGWFTIFVGEYMFNFALLIVFGFFVNSCGYQKTILCKEKEND